MNGDNNLKMVKRKLSRPSLARSAEPLYQEIRAVLESARAGAYRAVNAAMVQAYWNVGRLIVEHEQGGAKRAAYGEAILEDLSRRLTAEYGRGFTATNLRYMRQFYLAFPNHHALRDESESTALRPELYYERLLASRKKAPVRKEAATKPATVEPEQFIRDPYVLEFLNLKDYPALRESAVEQVIINNLQAFLLELGRGFSFVARQIFAARYMKVLPTEAQLAREIKRERRLIEVK